jgi:TolB-like protein/Tfp pilus assembly protein PilF
MVAARSTQFTLGLLGPFRLQKAGGERIEIPSRKGIALIAMLAMADEGERTRGWLQDKLWGQRGQAEGRGSLRRELSNLRKLLNQDAPPLLVFERDRVRLCIELIDVDARRLAMEHAAPVRGEFLEGLDIPGEEGFEDWLREQRTELASHRQQAGARTAARQEVPAALPSHINDLSQLPPGFDGQPALAVLPFENLTGDSDFDYFAEGISEELIERLSRVRWLPVIARSSSFSFPASADRSAVGRSLGAKYLLDGRVRRGKDAYALAIELSDATSGYTIWSQRFPLQSARSFDALDEILAETVVHLDTKIDYAEQIQARVRRPEHPNVDYLIWRGRWHVNRLTRADSEMAQQLFAEALRLDPDSPEALIQSTFALAWAIWAGRQPKDRILEMKRLAQRAILADCDDGRGYLLAGMAEMWLRNHDPARTLFKQALTLNPSLALAHAELGSSYNLANEPLAAIPHLKTALRLSPNDMHIFYPLGELAMAYSMLERWSDAIENAEQALFRRPAYWYAQIIRIDALARSGATQAATRAYDDLLTMKPDFSVAYLNWLPFIDHTWVDHFVEGLRMASGGRLIEAAPPSQQILATMDNPIL